MKERLATVVGVLLVAACGTFVLAAQQKPVSAGVLLGQALHQEQSEGRLEDAIAAYKKVVAAADATREQKARAQFRIGACYERLGLAEARQAYESVVANYSDQAGLAAEAKTRLAALAEPVARGSGPMLRQIWATSEGGPWWSASPDGRAVAGVDGNTGDLVIRSIATGDTQRLTAIPKDRWWVDFADNPVWSRDGRYVAYTWHSGKHPSEFRIADVAARTSRTVPIEARFRLYSPEDWSPDGRMVLARVEEGSPAKRTHLAWVATTGGSVRALFSLEDRQLSRKAFLSPDGAWIVYLLRLQDDRLSIIPAGGGESRTLVPVAPSDSLVGWSPDGTHVLFFSRARGTDDLMALRVANGQAVGQPFLIRTLQASSSLGISYTGAFVYSDFQRSTLDLYRASLDTISGRVGAPSSVDLSAPRSTASPSWSADGRRLAYVSSGRRTPIALSIWLAGTLQITSFTLPFAETNTYTPTKWSADGHWVYAAGLDDAHRAGICRVNTENGQAEVVLSPASGVFPNYLDPKANASLVGWSPDARFVYKRVIIYEENGERGPVAIVEHHISDHAEQEVFRSRRGATLSSLAVSPDGTQLAFSLNERAPVASGLIVVPAAGGSARTVMTLPGPGVRVTWTPDGRSVVLTAALGSGEAWLCHVTSGAVTKLTLPPELVPEIAVSPDGRQIAYTGGPRARDHGVWMLENFLPKATAQAPKK